MKDNIRYQRPNNYHPPTRAEMLRRNSNRNMLTSLVGTIGAAGVAGLFIAILGHGGPSKEQVLAAGQSRDEKVTCVTSKETKPVYVEPGAGRLALTLSIEGNGGGIGGACFTEADEAAKAAIIAESKVVSLEDPRPQAGVRYTVPVEVHPE